MLWGNYALGLILIVIIIGIILYIKNKNEKENINYTENFLALDETNFYMKSTEPTKANDNKPVDIQYQIPVTANQLSTTELQSIDTDVLRNVRNLANFSMTDEFNFYVVGNIINKSFIQYYIKNILYLDLV